MGVKKSGYAPVLVCQDCYCEEVGPDGAMAGSTLTYLRQVMKNNDSGWLYKRDGDYCPECADYGDEG